FLLAALATPAHAAPRLSVELGGALFLRNDPQGSFWDEELALGARAAVGLDRAFALPEALRLDAGLLWYASSRVDGTDAVQVRRTLYSFALPIAAGWELDYRPFEALRLTPYLTAGPAVTRTSVTYRVADPFGRRQGLAPVETDAGAWDAGGLYGAGLAVRAPEAPLGLGGRLEVARLHRGPYADLAFALGLGASF